MKMKIRDLPMDMPISSVGNVADFARGCLLSTASKSLFPAGLRLLVKKKKLKF